MENKDTSIVSSISKTTPIYPTIFPKTTSIIVEEPASITLIMYESPIEFVVPQYQPGSMSIKKTTELSRVPGTLHPSKPISI